MKLIALTYHQPKKFVQKKEREMLNFIIGLAGKKGAGKGEFVRLLKTMADRRGLTIEHLKSSDILAETLKLWQIPVSRANLKTLAVAMDKCFGNGTLSAAMQDRMRRSAAKIIIFDGVRWPSDITAVRMFFNNILIFIDTDIKIRYERIKNRGEKQEERNLSWKQFLAEEYASTETFMDEIKNKTDMLIDNNGGRTNLKKAVTAFFSKYCACEKGGHVSPV